ncbi:MAG: VOC family protein [candidate division WOR-3 bacterium]|nr:VOC family protein [candidate division WOR-3 bacterium]
MNKKNYKCDHIGILTRNSERLLKFYKNIIKFKLISGERLKPEIVGKLFKMRATACFYRLKSNGLLLEIFELHKKYESKKGKIHYGIHHFGLIVDDREKFIKYLRRKKVKIITIKRGSRLVYFIQDPDGNIIEIREENR